MKQTTFRGFKLFYENRDATESMIRAADDFPSVPVMESLRFDVSQQPTVIDCGANIGVSVLEWKTRWPMARIICFEPDPFAFRLLQKNIDSNDIPAVKCFQAALSDTDGRCEFYGQIGKGADARGNSVNPQWGQRQQTACCRVPCRRLSPFLDQPVAFLKMDIEGLEESVLRESAHRLTNVQSIYVEVHETDALRQCNSKQRIEQLLIEAGFRIDNESRYQPHALPPALRRWQRQVGARQSHVFAWR